MSKRQSEHVYLIRDGRVATIVLNRPEKLNALYPPMVIRFAECIEEVRQDRQLRVLVVRGEGRAFCAGDDLAPEDRFRYGAPDPQTRIKTGYQRLVLELLNLRKPVVGVVHGYAVGAGLDIALACDFRIAGSGVRMGAVFIKRGLGGGCAYLLPRFVGLGKATEMLLLGETIGAEEAQTLGLVTQVVSEAALLEAGYALAQRLAEGPTHAYGAIKIARNQGLGGDPAAGVMSQTLANAELMLHRDAREGPRAWREGREPRFTGDWIDLQYDQPCDSE